MNKIGILTLVEEDNYGAVIQAYALQKTLRKIGTDSEFVRFEGRKKEPVSTVHPLQKMLMNAQESRRALFENFRNKHLAFSPVYKTTDDINDRYSCFIAGSDQIWNFSLPSVDARYLLPFAKSSKRCSYAASFGTGEIPDAIREQLKKRLSDFCFISVREENGREIVKDLTGKDAYVSLDPSLLLTEKDYSEIEEFEEKENYAFCFMLDYDENLKKQAEKYATDNNIKLITVTASFMPMIGISEWNSTGVEKWIGYIHHSRAVFTNSFHCAALSLIFGKLLKVNLLQNELAKRNGRIVELLKSAEMDKCLQSAECLSAERFQELISERKEASLAYLNMIVEHSS